MPRPRKHRRVCHYPDNLTFAPVGAEALKEPVTLTVDEYETIRLIDKDGCSQEECAEFMGVARTTVQQIYASARQKIARMLVEGSPLEIRGGDFRLCDGSGNCSRSGCFLQHYRRSHETPKGEHIMRIAVTYENGAIFQHFGHTQQFKVYDVQDGVIVSAQVVDTCGQGHGALAGVLSALKADVLICGGIGGGAQMALASAGVKLFGGVSGDADAAVEAFLAGKLAFNPDVRCNHHDHHHGEDHHCGSHGCGSHTCGH